MGQAGAKVREQLGHPVVDCDGHAIEVTQVLLDYLEAVGGPAVVDRYRQAPIKRPYLLAPDAPYWGTADSGAWVQPTRNTLDRATATLPRLYAERLGEFGIDFAIIYPSEGLFPPQFDDEELRLAGCRAYNTYIADTYRPYAEQMTVAAVIPTHNPTEAIAELTYAVNELGLKAAVFRSYVRRPGNKGAPDRLDFLALGSDHDYDPLWAACAELKVAATFHTSAVYGGRAQIPNYSYNHIGILGAGGEAICKALFMGGVTRRFPELRFAFLEGGVGWAVSLYADLRSHWERRSAGRIDDYDPAVLDRELFFELLARYGDDNVQRHRAELEVMFSAPQPDVQERDNFAAVQMTNAEEMLDLFVAPFFFGCEADDPVTAHAFDRRVNAFGAALQAVLGTDNAHWDVTDMAGVLGEAYELVEDGRVSAADFRDLVFTNPVKLHGGMNPDFFRGTAVEQAVDGLLSAV